MEYVSNPHASHANLWHPNCIDIIKKQLNEMICRLELGKLIQSLSLATTCAKYFDGHVATFLSYMTFPVALKTWE
jgi:hypothetical protein